MGPIRLLVDLVAAIILGIILMNTAHLMGAVVNDFYYIITGQNFTWDAIPEPFHDVAESIWDSMMPNILVIVIVLTLVVDFAMMFRKTNEGVVVWR